MDVTNFGDVLTLGRSIHQAAWEIQNLADEWVTITAEHKSKVESLRIKIDFYGLEMDRNGMPVDHIMVKNLQKAVKWLKNEELKVRQLDESINSGECCAMWWWIYAKVTMMTFPQKLEKALKRVTDEIDNVTTNLKVEAEVADYIRKWKERQAVPTNVHNNDGLYVLIKASQEQVENEIEKFATLPLQRSDLLDRRSDLEQVRSAREKFAGLAPLQKSGSWPRSILLHGGVGQGKSALAYNVCALYSKDGEKGNHFDHVILVSCGNCSISDPVKKQVEILKRLSPNSLSASIQREESDPEDIAATLQRFLSSSKKILIILDGVSDQNLLHKMWAAAQGSDHVKYLVTSRMSDLCSSLTENSCPIQMGDPTQDEARTILATHAGFEETSIPDHLKEITEKMIKVTEGNPLALACLTSSFKNRQDRENIQAWQEASCALYNLLDKPVSKIVFGQKYHETPWASMRDCIGSLTDDAKVILLLMYACSQEQSIPEAVIRLLYSPIKKTSFAFFNSLAELSTRDLLKQSTSTLALGKDHMEEYLQESRAWSLRSLVKLYIDWDMARKVRNEVSTSEIVSEEESPLKTRLKNVIRVLLGDDAITLGWGAVIRKLESGIERSSIESKERTLKGKMKSRIEADTTISKENTVKGKPESQMDGARDAIELEKDTGKGNLESKIRVINSEKKVIAVLCALYFDQSGSRTPLSFDPDRPLTDEVVASASCWACTVSKLSGSIDTTDNLRRRKAVEPIIRLLDLLQADDRPWIPSVIDALREVFLKYVCEGQLDNDNIRFLLDLTTYPRAPLATLTAIAYIFSQEETPLLKTRHLGFLSTIVRLLEPDEGVIKSIREAASEALFYISKKAGKKQSSVFINIPFILPVSVRSIEDSLAKNAGATLESVDHNPLLLQNAKFKGARKYAAVGGKSIKRQILGVRQGSIQHWEPINKRQTLALGGKSLERPTSNESVTLAGPGAGLDSMDQNPILLQNVVGTLMNLAAGPDPMKQQILDEDGALGVLVKCLCKDRNASVQENAVGAFMNLALGGEQIKSRILDEDGAVAGLVSSLSNQYSPSLQARAAATLRDLANGSEASISRIANEKGALGGLVESLSKDQNLGLQANTAGALENLASGDQEQIKLRILDEDGALAGLVKSLSKYHNPILQEKAAGTLRNLATVGESSKPRILIQDGAVAGLVNCLFVDNNSDLQQSAVEALLNLAGGGESIKLQILKEERALAGLVQSLSKDHNRILQEKAAGALSNLARGGESIKSKILNEKDQALAELVKSLSKDGNPLLQENAAGALLNLAAGSESIKQNILNKDGALLGLVKALFKAHPRGLQENALGALLNLALGEEESKLKILNVDRALVALLKYLSTHGQTPIVQEYATGTMDCLANTEGFSNMLNMNNNDTLLKEAFEKFEGTYAPSRHQALGPNEFLVRSLSPKQRFWDASSQKSF